MKLLSSSSSLRKKNRFQISIYMIKWLNVADSSQSSFEGARLE